jgi:actin-related protein
VRMQHRLRFHVSDISFPSFASGRGTALVVDVGSYWTSVVPVVDGFVLRKGKSRIFGPSSCVHSSLRYSKVGAIFVSAS